MMRNPAAREDRGIREVGASHESDAATCLLVQKPGVILVAHRLFALHLSGRKRRTAALGPKNPSSANTQSPHLSLYVNDV